MPRATDPAQGSVQRFGDVALAQKFVTREQLEAAIERQKEIRLPIGEVLVEMGFVTPSQVAAILKYQRALSNLEEKQASERDPFVGETLGGCLILESIGAGAMGRAYKAHHLKLDRDVCVKLLHPELVKDRRTQARFAREARSAARLEHPGIVTVYDFDEIGPYSFMVMQYVDGKSLKQVLEQRGPVGPKRATFVGARLAEALACAHAEGIVHRDVKPANVLVSKRGEIKLMDFGLVRVIEKEREDGASSTFGELIGTPIYMSPEQAQASSEIDGHSDVYSLGIVIYELATGKVPFAAPSLLELLRMHLSQPLPRVRDLCPESPPELDELLQSFTEKNPAHRPDAARAARELRTLYRSAFGADPPSDVTGPAGSAIRTPASGSTRPGTTSFADLPTGFYGLRDVMEVAVDKLVARALQGDFVQAAKDTRRLGPAGAREAACRMISGLAAADRHDEILAGEEAVLEVVKEDAEALATIARAHVSKGSTAEAEPLLALAASKSPEDPAVALELAHVRAALGNKVGALAALEALVARRPADPDVHRRAAEVRYIVLGDLEGAAGWFGRAADLDRNAYEPRQQQGHLLLEIGRADAAVKALEDAVARQPSSSLAHELLGKARKLKGDSLGAQAALRRALDLDPRSAEARLLLIEEARYTRRWSDAARLAAEGLALFPQDRELQFELARAREAEGDRQAAARLFANILETNPAHEAARAALERLKQR